MRRRKLWRAVLAGAVIGLVEAAGLDRERRHRRRPIRIVWLDDREPADPLAGSGVWFLEPLDSVRPNPGDLRREHGRRVGLIRLHPRALAEALRQRGS